MATADIYRQIVSIPGDVLDIGTWRGQTAVLCENFRAIYEPLHFNRRIVCFDTFEGYKGYSERTSQPICTVMEPIRCRAVTMQNSCVNCWSCTSRAMPWATSMESTQSSRAIAVKRSQVLRAEPGICCARVFRCQCL